MPINPQSVTRPARMTAKTYTPPGATQYKVRNDDTWVNLAAGRHTTPWELIRFNYPGLSMNMEMAMREVNWYLQNYVGCTQLTTDQRNFRFSAADNPGFIWLPNPSATATADEAARQIVLSVLRGPGIAQLNFGVGRFYIASTAYEQVADAIERGFITVHADPALSNHAFYHSDVDRLDVAPGITDLGLVVHECTHAIFDIRYYNSVAAESEGIAYIAQALYAISRWGPRPRYFPSVDLADPVSWVSWQNIFDESMRLATALQTNPYVSADEAAVLFWSINHANMYRGRVGTVDGYNGLDPTFY